MLLSRIIDAEATWLGLKEASTKLLPRMPQQSFRNHLNSCKAKSRTASEHETTFLFQCAAIKTRAQKVTLIEIKGVCSALRKVLGSHPLVPRVATISSLPAHDHDMQASLQEQPSPPSSAAEQLSPPGDSLPGPLEPPVQPPS